MCEYQSFHLHHGSINMYLYPSIYSSIGLSLMDIQMDVHIWSISTLQWIVEPHNKIYMYIDKRLQPTLTHFLYIFVQICSNLEIIEKTHT